MKTQHPTETLATHLRIDALDGNALANGKADGSDDLSFACSQAARNQNIEATNDNVILSN